MLIVQNFKSADRNRFGDNYMSIVEADVFETLVKMENRYITPAFIAERLKYGVDAEEEIRSFIDPLCRSDPKTGKTPNYGAGQYQITSIEIFDKNKKITAYKYVDTALEFLG